MATEQLPATQYLIGGQPTVTNYVVRSATFGIEEDTEDKQGADGKHVAKLTYSRRKTLQLELEALGTATQGTYQVGGALDVDYVPTAVGGNMVWKIRDASEGLTRGAQTVSLDLISLTDELA
jgi:hypothetical protein